MSSLNSLLIYHPSRPPTKAQARSLDAHYGARTVGTSARELVEAVPLSPLALVAGDPREESGCGKTVTALAIMGLVQSPPGKIANGEILYHRGEKTTDLAKLPPKGRAMRAIRGNEIAMIFQEAMTLTQPPETGPETELGSGSMEGGTRWREGTTDPRRSSPSCARRRSCWPKG